MTTPTNHWKLGLFVVVASFGAVALLIWLGSQSFRAETVRYVSFFDETVTGLEIGSPVNFRGVRIGSVALIGLAPDTRHVEVGYDLEVEVLEHMGLATKRRGHLSVRLPDAVRVQIASTGVTGVKHVKLDYLPESPPVKLDFPVPENYIPASPSTLKSLEDAVVRALADLPKVVERALSVLSRADGLIAEVQVAALPAKASLLLANANRTVDVLHGKVEGVDSAGISQKANLALGELNQVLARAHDLVRRVDGDSGLLDSVQRATDAMGEVAVDARGTAPKLNQTLEHVSEAAVSMQRLLDALERDPDMLLKGRAEVAR